MVQDDFVLIPNAFGTLFGIVQLVLYGFYWRLERNIQWSYTPIHQEVVSPPRYSDDLI